MYDWIKPYPLAQTLFANAVRQYTKGDTDMQEQNRNQNNQNDQNKQNPQNKQNNKQGVKHKGI